MRIAIFGAGGMGRELAEIVQAGGRAEIIFVVDEPCGEIDGIQVIRPEELADDDRLVIALGESADRRAVAERLKDRPLASVVSSLARVSPSAELGDGAMVCDFALINSRCRIGRHFQANCYAQVSHDCVIGDFVTLSPHVSCNGWVEIGDDVFVGAGAVIRNGKPDQRLKIGRGARIGMGAIITRDVPPGAVMLGAKAVPKA